MLNRYEGEVDCAVSLNAQLLFKMPSKQQLSRYLNDQSIQLQGDLQVLQDFTALLEFLEKDPAELLSPFVGDVIAQSAVDSWFLSNRKTQIERKPTILRRAFNGRMGGDLAKPCHCRFFASK
nr:SCP2 sterol-binding domain-containing protein [Avibacterium endocarditidis]